MEQEHTRLSLGVGVAGLALLAAHQTILLQSYPLAVQPPSSGAWGVWLLHTLGHSLLYLQETCWHQAPGMVQLQQALSRYHDRCTIWQQPNVQCMIHWPFIAAQMFKRMPRHGMSLPSCCWALP